ncbi:MAG: hypothetical protein ACLP2P_02470 [Desulfobaccales bacterium]
MKGWEKFKKLMFDNAKDILIPSFKDYSKELGEALWNSLHNIDGPTVINKPLNKKEIYFGKIFFGFNEIFSSIQALKDIEVYIGTFPYKNKQITKIRYLNYNIENYFNEIYLLKERLLSYVTIIDRCHKKNIYYIAIKDKIKILVEESLKNIVYTRSRHVHKHRFEAKNIERLKLMDLLTLSEEIIIGNFMTGYYKITFIKIRNEWKQIIKNNNIALIKLLDIYSDIIKEVLFDRKTGKLIYPNE